MKLLFSFILVLFTVTSGLSQKAKEILYVGTFKTRGAEGIYVYEFDRARNRMKQIQVMPTPESPSFIAVHPSGKYLYSVNRGSIDEMPNSGSVSAFSIDKTTGMLTLLNSRPSYGSGPCHISFDKTGKWAFISNYSEGNFVILSLFDDGLLGTASDSRKHTGSSVHPQRQNKAYVHSATVSPDNRFVMVCDLGTDKIHSYRFDATNGRIISEESSEVSLAPGSGPRHFTFHPKLPFAYAAEELSSTVCSFKYDAATGTLTILNDSIPSLPTGYSGTNTAADIHTDSKGNYLYMSNRGANGIATYSIAADGALTFLASQDTKGRTPRNFLVDLRGDFVLAANQDSDTITYLKRDQKSGLLKYTGLQWRVPSPVCLQMLVLK